jgi:hypothetical protein
MRCASSASKYLMCKHPIMTESRAIGQRAIWVGISLSVVCLAYFYMLDRIMFSSMGFSPIFRFLLARDSRAAWISVAICCVAALWNRPAPILRLVEFLDEHASWVAVVSVTLFAVGAGAVYRAYPLSMDEYAAVFQAKIFAAGHLSALLPSSYVDWLVVRGFNGEFLIASRETGRVIEVYWPGFAMLLAPFEFLHAQWLCNACVAGLALLLIHWITKEITHESRASGWALLFALGSAAFAANAISFYSLQAHLTANLLFVALLLRPNRHRALCAGLVGSLALNLHNTVPHTLFAIPWLLAILLERQQRRFFLPLILGYLPGLAIGLGWLLLRADIGSAGQTPAGIIGLTHGVFTWPTASVLNTRAASFVKMWVWAVPCLFVFAIMGCIRYREHSKVRLLASSAVLTFMGYLFVSFDQGHGWGYRYFHSAWGVIPILAGCAMTNGSSRDLKAASYAGACAILSLVIMVPLQLSEIQQFISQHLAQLPSPRRPGNNVYFIRPRGGFYVADMVHIDPLLRDPDLLLVSRGTELDAKMINENWPDAIKIRSGPSYDQWYLGPMDRRQRMPGAQNTTRFVLRANPYEPIPPSAADR